MSCGAALQHLRLAIRAFGYATLFWALMMPKLMLMRRRLLLRKLQIRKGIARHILVYPD